MSAMYAEAKACFFVSEHNRRLTEEQLGFELPRATVVRNPFLVRPLPVNAEIAQPRMLGSDRGWWNTWIPHFGQKWCFAAPVLKL